MLELCLQHDFNNTIFKIKLNIYNLRVCPAPHPATKEEFRVRTQSQTRCPLQNLKRGFYGTEVINVSAQTAVRDP